MQTYGHLVINNQKVLILARHKKYGRALKIRLTGKDGNFFEDESYFLLKNKEVFDRLLSGEVIDI